MNTPFRRDIIRELAQACRRHGVRLGFYHSIMDWHHPDYLPRRSWEASTRPAAGASMDRYFEYLKTQVTELLTNYGDVAVMWFDGEWESTWNDRYGRELYDLCRRLQPKTIVNNRVANNRGGTMEDEGKIRIGDYATPEQWIPPKGIALADWEVCMTMNDHWGYNAANHNWKSSTQMVRMLVDIASKGGNYLLNVGPRADGTFPPESVERLKEIGGWMRKNGESIYGTTASPFDPLPWGRVTRKGNRLYVHVFEWPKDGRLELPGLATPVRAAHLLGGPTIKTERAGTNVAMLLPATSPNPADTVVVLELASAPVVYRAPKVEASDEFVRSGRLSVADVPGVEWRYTSDGTEPTASSPRLQGALAIDRTASINIVGFAGGKAVTATARRTMKQVTPWPAVDPGSVRSGLRLDEFRGTWDRVPDFSTLTPVRTSAGAVEPSKEGRVARRYTGYLLVDETEMHQFELTGDDGAKLWIDGKLVIDNDGLHASQTKRGQAPLTKGYHRIEIAWFNATGGAALDLKGAVIGQPIAPLRLVY
jgi:alpha-L-fucosidase